MFAGHTTEMYPEAECHKPRGLATGSRGHTECHAIQGREMDADAVIREK